MLDYQLFVVVDTPTWIIPVIDINLMSKILNIIFSVSNIHIEEQVLIPNLATRVNVNSITMAYYYRMVFCVMWGCLALLEVSTN